MKRVYVTQDNDCHWYVLPYELKEQFIKSLENDDFDDLYEQYRTGGDINLIKLYTDEI